VHTAWDIGVGDYTAIWCFQLTPGRIRLVGYYQNSGEGMPFYITELRRMATERGWAFGRFYARTMRGCANGAAAGLGCNSLSSYTAQPRSWRTISLMTASMLCGKYFKSASLMKAHALTA
jgi:hypothetical protein